MHMTPYRHIVQLAPALLFACVLAGCATTARTGPPTTDNARTSLDWPGTYYGVLPCADCAGIATTVTLEPDGTFRSRLLYLGKDGASFEDHGRLAWNAAGSTVTLEGSDAARYFVGESHLLRVGADGSRVTGSLASRYVLTKGPVPLAGPRWELLAIGSRDILDDSPLPFIAFDPDHRAHGFDGCNRLTGTYSLEQAAGHLRFGEIAATRRFCAGAMETAQALATTLRQTRGYSIRGGELTLRSSDGTSIARFIALPADASVDE